MAETSKETAPDKVHTIRWPGESWDRIERAAEKLGAETRVEVTPVDLIRGATMHRVDEILNAGV